MKHQRDPHHPHCWISQVLAADEMKILTYVEGTLRMEEITSSAPESITMPDSFDFGFTAEDIMQRDVNAPKPQLAMPTEVPARDVDNTLQIVELGVDYW